MRKQEDDTTPFSLRLARLFALSAATIAIAIASALLAMSSGTEANERGKFLLFVPGFATTSDSPFGMSPILEAILNEYDDVEARLYSYRGFNQSYTMLDTALSLENDAQEVSTYFTEAGIRNRHVYIIGHSLGGVVAIAVCAPEYDHDLPWAV